VNLPPYTELGWDQPDFKPVDLPVAPATKTDAGATKTAVKMEPAKA
jgi:hypothetical protein